MHSSEAVVEMSCHSSGTTVQTRYRIFPSLQKVPWNALYHVLCPSFLSLGDLSFLIYFVPSHQGADAVIHSEVAECLRGVSLSSASLPPILWKQLPCSWGRFQLSKKHFSQLFYPTSSFSCIADALGKDHEKVWWVSTNATTPNSNLSLQSTHNH
jgi:hypothetical protein